MELLLDFPTQLLPETTEIPELALSHPIVSSFLDPHLGAKITCDWKCILILSILGCVYLWHIIIMAVDMGAWAEGNLALLWVTFYTTAQAANNAL